ncbi:MAG: response regulator [Methylobacter sp.]|nr:response regulator [Methylobacter sp.]MDP2429325.1 response regulator [Methylobacter sp.]MDP3055036.1 response regulator [Methylobacter sp.]MDP3363706.1 response regulator [Methylobacter sp.]MDZ4217543.1 response regulator [Methylobacter sp.]
MLTQQHILKNLNLLFVDDNAEMCADIYALFSGVFKSITVANNAAMALHIYRQQTIDFIITDIKMPGRDGLSFVEKIRAEDAFIPIVILSAFTDTDYLLRAANLQIDGYVAKPLNFKKLNAALMSAIRRLGTKMEPVIIAPHVHYLPLEKSLQVDGIEVSLGNKEGLLLELLLFSPERVVSKQLINDTVWPNQEMTDSALKNLLSELRKKLSCDVIKNRPAQGWYIHGCG